MKILAVSDIELGFLYQSSIVDRFYDVDLILSCGDLPHYYLEYMISMLNIPLYYVNGNHAHRLEITTGGERNYPWGAVNIHKRTLTDDTGLLLAGIEGCQRYNLGQYQYTQSEMWMMIFKLIPGLIINKLRFGRFLDIFLSHAPPWKIHDQNDLPHQGIKAFRWFINVFQPTYHLHGHIHVYRNDTITITKLNKTEVINCYGYRELFFDIRPFIKNK
jgi:Icc-related predicted phosphoesterase